MRVLTSERVVCSSSGTDRIDGLDREDGRIDGREDGRETSTTHFFLLGGNRSFASGATIGGFGDTDDTSSSSPPSAPLHPPCVP